MRSARVRIAGAGRRTGSERPAARGGALRWYRSLGGCSSAHVVDQSRPAPAFAAGCPRFPYIYDLRPTFLDRRLQSILSVVQLLDAKLEFARKVQGLNTNQLLKRPLPVPLPTSNTARFLKGFGTILRSHSPYATNHPAWGLRPKPQKTKQTPKPIQNPQNPAALDAKPQSPKLPKS